VEVYASSKVHPISGKKPRENLFSTRINQGWKTFTTQSSTARLPKKTWQEGYQAKSFHTGKKFIKYSKLYVKLLQVSLTHVLIGCRVAAKEFNGNNAEKGIGQTTR